MKKSILLGLLLISLVLISGISGCQISKENIPEIITKLKASYSNIDDAHFYIKQTSTMLGFPIESICQEGFIKRPDSSKTITYRDCNRENIRSIMIYKNNLSYYLDYDYPNQINKRSYIYNIGEKSTNLLLFEDEIDDLLMLNLMLDVEVSEESSDYRFVFEGAENEKIELWVDKQSYLVHKVKVKGESGTLVKEILEFKINEGIQDSEFEPTQGIPIVEMPSALEDIKQTCQKHCKSKYTVPVGSLDEGQFYYCLAFDYGYRLFDDNSKTVHCWEDPINVECPEIEC